MSYLDRNPKDRFSGDVAHLLAEVVQQRNRKGGYFRIIGGKFSIFLHKHLLRVLAEEILMISHNICFY